MGRDDALSKQAAQVVEILVESDLVRVCAACEKEFGPVRVGPGQQKSHGFCRRHSTEYYPDSVQLIAGMPDSFFCPDLKGSILESPDAGHQLFRVGRGPVLHV